MPRVDPFMSELSFLFFIRSFAELAMSAGNTLLFVGVIVTFACSLGVPVSAFWSSSMALFAFEADDNDVREDEVDEDDDREE